MNALLTPISPRRRILALDGGGVRGVFTLEVLARMEELLRGHHARPELRLCEHFDLIAGTSTGAIIAAMLSWGMTVDDVRRLYHREAERMFIRAPWWRRSAGWFNEKNLSDMLRQLFVEEDGSPALLGTSKLSTLLLLVLRNATTGAAWPLTNNPAALYNQRARPDGTPLDECNLNLPLWQLVRASTAAPLYFPPEVIPLGAQHFEFMDGGITAYNNPALIAFLTATQPCYHIGWPAGEELLHLISIGTGQTRALVSERLRRVLDIVGLASMVPRGLMDSISREQDLLCRVLGKTLHGSAIDSEANHIAGLNQFTYARYNREFTPEEVTQAERECGGRFSLDNVRMIDFLIAEGRQFAAQVRLEHLL